MSTTTPQNHPFTFPPFPKPPKGVTIIPFKDFKEHGIQMNLSGVDREEVDGLGIPTVEMRAKHDTDKCKTRSIVKSMKKANLVAPPTASLSDMQRKRMEWWEVWEEGEDLRVSANYQPTTSEVDRLFQAAHDFRTNRTWPPMATGVRALWDQYRLFIGLLSNTPIWRKIEKNTTTNAHSESPDEDEEYLSDEMPDTGTTTTDVHIIQSTNDQKPDNQPPRHPRPRPPYANYGVEAPEVETNDEILALLDGASCEKEEKMGRFLQDPEGRTRVFLSSYMRDQGLIWSDRNLINVPLIVGFFLKFLVRNHVLPMRQGALERAVKVAEVARCELPLTSRIGKDFPDEFSKACRECWGSKAGGYEPMCMEDGDGDGDERETKRQKVDGGEGGHAGEFEAELKAANVEVISTGEVDLGLLKQVVEDNVGEDVEMGDGGWGAGGGGEWGTVGDTATWGDEVWGDKPVVVGGGGGMDDGVDVSGWTAPTYSLMAILGPTVLPLTHTCGIVEWSVRRVKAVVLPAQAGGGGRGGGGVEMEMQARLAKVILEPWLPDDNGEDELFEPKILPQSRGAAIGFDGEAVGMTRMSRSGFAVPVHDVRKDDVTVLAVPGVVASLRVGMGLAATFVQIVRSEQGKVKKKGGKRKGGEGSGEGKEKEKEGETFWYMEQLMMILPSYHTA